MDQLDFKKADRAFYTAKPERFDLLTIPPMRFLMIDGEGDPNTAPAYGRAVAALFALAYGIRFYRKTHLAKVHVVPPLEGLWWADDMNTFVTRKKSAWKWTMCLRQPEDVDAAMLKGVRNTVVAKNHRKKDAPTDAGTLEQVRLETLDEGLCMQVLHIGLYDDEGPVLAQMHDREIPAAGLEMHGRHHEIYLSDPRRVAPEKIKTILRQPVRSRAVPPIPTISQAR